MNKHIIVNVSYHVVTFVMDTTNVNLKLLEVL
jgi:hypothetical protein